MDNHHHHRLSHEFFIQYFCHHTLLMNDIRINNILIILSLSRQSKIEKNNTKEHKKKGGENTVKNLHDMDYLNLYKR
jgi:hypothetical protein